MDIFKILSRSTKKSAIETPTLPSAGAIPNPQLFHDDISPCCNKKRKRDGQAAEGPLASEQLPEVDFFAPKQTSLKIASEPALPTAGETADNVGQEVPPVERLDKEECRRLLTSHRLKFTLMSDHEEKAETKQPKRKKEKGKEREKGEKLKRSDKEALRKQDPKRSLFPQPMNSFQELRTTYGIAPRLSDNLAKQSYRLPTEVQMASLPLLLRPEIALANDTDDVSDLARGIDFLAVAPTGSGKTVSFLVPAIDGIVRRRSEEGLRQAHSLEVVVVAPTRELAHQIANEGKKVAAGTGVRITSMRSGMRIVAQETEVEAEDDGENASESAPDLGDDNVMGPEDEDGRSSEGDESGKDVKDAEDVEDDEDDGGGDENNEDGEVGGDTVQEGREENRRRKRSLGPIAKADILVTTPLMLLTFLTSGPKRIRRSLPAVRSLVLDEADVLLDPLFREQTMGIWSACTNPNLRFSLWSATMGSSIEALISEKHSTMALHAPLVRLVVGLKDTAVPNVAHKLIYTATEPGKLLAIRQLLRPTSQASGPPLRPPFIVFTQTIERATALHSELKYDIPPHAGGSSRIAALHSGLSDTTRAAIMRKFRAGEVWILITTDVLARGVDFAGVNGVVNYDVPSSSAAYVHRAGRTGRAGREGGVAVTLYTKDDIPFMKTVANVIAASERQAGKETADGAGVQKWLLDGLPRVSKADRKKLKKRGVEVRRKGGRASRIDTRSGWDRQRENNRRQAAEANRRRGKAAGQEDGGGSDWDGFRD